MGIPNQFQSFNIQSHAGKAFSFDTAKLHGMATKGPFKLSGQKSLCNTQAVETFSELSLIKPPPQ